MLTKKLSLLFFVAILIQSCSYKSYTATQKNEKKEYLSDAPAYIIYNNRGEKISYKEMTNELSKNQVILFGEYHDDPISHWLEYKIIEELFDRHSENLIVGCEMWETHQQKSLDQYFNGKINKKEYLSKNNLWPNTKTDYLPILDFCYKREVPFICTNIPRPIANLVAKSGIQALDHLTDSVKQFIPDLPIHVDLNESIYRSIIQMFKTSTWVKKTPMGRFKPERLAEAQACKDATMAHNIIKNIKNKNQRFFHFNGERHSTVHSGINYYLKYYNKKIKTCTISVTKKKNIFSFKDSDNKADFNILVPNNMTKTY